MFAVKRTAIRKEKGKGNEDKRQENFAGRQQTQIVETPDKITFSGSLTVGDLAKKLSKSHLKLLRSSSYLELWQQLTKTWIKIQLS